MFCVLTKTTCLSLLMLQTSSVLLIVSYIKEQNQAIECSLMTLTWALCKTSDVLGEV